MNEIDTVTIPKLLERETLPAGYLDTPDPYANPPKSQYNFRAMVNYALAQVRKVTDLSIGEARPFLIG